MHVSNAVRLAESVRLPKALFRVAAVSLKAAPATLTSRLSRLVLDARRKRENVYGLPSIQLLAHFVQQLVPNVSMDCFVSIVLSQSRLSHFKHYGMTSHTKTSPSRRNGTIPHSKPRGKPSSISNVNLRLI